MLDLLLGVGILDVVSDDTVSGELVDLGGLEAPSGNLVFEEQVEFTVRAALGLRQTEVAVKGGETSRNTPEDTGLGTPVPGGGRKHAGDDDTADDVHNLVGNTGKHDGLLSETGRGDLADEGVADGSEGGVVSEVEDDEERTDGEDRGLGADPSETTDDEEHDGHGCHTNGVERATTEDSEKTPGEDSTDDEHGVENHVQREGSVGRDTSCLQELNTLTDQVLAGEELHGEDHHDDFGTASVGLAEAVEVGGTGGSLHLEFVGVDHHRDGGLGVVGGDLFLVGETADGGFGFFETTLADEPPWGRRAEPDDEEEGTDPDPLEDEGKTPTPVTCDGQSGLDDTGRKQDTDTPAEIDVGGKVTTELNRADFGGVGSGKCLEDSPWDTAKDFADDEHGKGVGKDHDEDETSESDDGGHHDDLGTPAVSSVTVEEKTDDAAGRRTVGEGGLPLSGDNVAVGSAGRHNTEALKESGMTIV